VDFFKEHNIMTPPHNSGGESNGFSTTSSVTTTYAEPVPISNGVAKPANGKFSTIPRYSRLLFYNSLGRFASVTDTRQYPLTA
jgi:hypothetical protein